MKLKTVLIAAAIIGIVAPASAQSLEVKPDSFEENIVSGETIKKNFSLSWSGETDTIASLDAIYKNSNGEKLSEGFNTSFSSNPVIVENSGEKKIQANITTHPALAKDNYSIEIEASSQIEEKTTSSGGGGGGTDIVYVDDSDNGSEENNTEVIYRDNESLEEKLEKLREDRNRLDNRVDELKGDHEIITDEMAELVQEKKDLNRTIQVLESKNENLKNEKLFYSTGFMMTGSVFLIIFVVSAVLAFVKREELLEWVRARRQDSMVSELSGAEDV